MSVAVVGFDLGYQNCFVSVARGGGIETVANEYSDRCTPTCISFGTNSRNIGTAAKNQQVSNVKNTVFGFTRLLGRLFSDPVVQEERKKMPYEVIALPGDRIGVSVDYLGEKQVFSPEQLVAMQLTKLKEVAESNLQTKVVDVVVNISSSATDLERRALLDATEISGLKCIRVINDTTAVGVAYGLYNKDLPQQDSPSRNVVFVDMGASTTQITIIAFNDGKMKVINSVSDRQLGGRDFDRLLFEHIAAEFQQKYRINVLQSPKATVRLLQECEKLKRLMSSSATDISLNIECFMEDKDVSTTMKRQIFEELAAPLLERATKLLQRSLEESGLQLENVDCVEIIGGSTRIPSLKAVIQQVFGKELRTTLNADEAVSRGCSLQCAILSPAFRVREFGITDAVSHSISLVYDEPNKANNTETTEVFPRGHPFPFSRQITFYRKEPFILNAVYTHPDVVGTRVQQIGSYHVQNVVPNAEGAASKIKVKVRVNVHGIFSVSQASLVEQVKKVVEEDASTAPPQATTDGAAPKEVNGTVPTEAGMDTGSPVPPQDGAADTSSEAAPAADLTASPTPAGGAEQQQPKTKIVQKLTDLPIQAQILHANDKQTVSECAEKEGKLIMQDKLEKERQAAKNFVEEYVYDMRDKLAGKYEPFTTDAERDDFNSKLSATEDWLYTDGEDLHKQAYTDRLNELRGLGEKIRIRCYEAETRPGVAEECNQLFFNIRRAIESYKAGEETYNHLDEADVKKLAQELEEKQKWFTHEVQLQNVKKLSDDPALTVDRIVVQKQALESFAKTILNKPKPRVEPPPATNEQQPNGAGADETPAKNAQADNQGGDAAAAPQPGDDMDID